MAITLARALKNRVPRVDMKREPVINPAIARHIARADELAGVPLALDAALAAAVRAEG